MGLWAVTKLRLDPLCYLKQALEQEARDVSALGEEEQKLFDSDLGEYTSFGIGVWELRAGMEPRLFVPDVSTDCRAVIKLAIRCTLGRLDPQQLMDVVEDFLC